MVKFYRNRDNGYVVEAKQYTGYESKIFDMPIVNGMLGNTIFQLKPNHWVVKMPENRITVFYPDHFFSQFELVGEDGELPF